MLQPSISIIVPLYNVEEYIEECLHSVARQTYRGNIECLIIDDCSTDNSVKKVEQFISGYNGNVKFVLLYHTHNRGVSAARNTGVDAANGEYIMFVDSDDFLSYDCLDKLTKPLDKYDYDFVTAGFSVYPNGKRQDNIQRDESFSGVNDIIRAICIDASIHAYIPNNKLVSRTLFLEHDLKFLEGQKIYEDLLWVYKLALCSKSVSVVNAATYYYRFNESGALNNLKNTPKAFYDMYSTVIYVLTHPVNSEFRNLSILLFMIKFQQRAMIPGVKYKREYFELRKLLKGIDGFNKILDIEHLKLKTLHLYLPPILGYWNLIIRRKRKKYF